MSKKITKTIITENLFPFSLDDHTYNGICVNPCFPYFDRGHLIEAKTFLIVEPLKLRLQVFFHPRLIRGKMTHPGAVKMDIPVEVNKSPIVKKRTHVEERRLGRKVS